MCFENKKNKTKQQQMIFEKVHSRYRDLVPKTDISIEDLQRPTEDEEKEQTEETRAALEKMLNNKLAAAKPRSGAAENGVFKKPTFIRYTPQNQGDAFNSGAQSRMIKLYDVPVDPLEPPKFAFVCFLFVFFFFFFFF